VPSFWWRWSGVQPLWPTPQCPGGAAGQRVSLEFRPNPDSAGPAAGGGTQARRLWPPADCVYGTIRERVSAALEHPVAEALQAARQQPVAYVDETGAPTVNADGGNPDRRRGWQWVMVKPLVMLFLQGLSRLAAAAIDLLGVFAGIVVSERSLLGLQSTVRRTTAAVLCTSDLQPLRHGRSPGRQRGDPHGTGRAAAAVA
jgi:hypothetical protein